MDFKSMKRKELQGLCRKHKIPANLSNMEMANNLAEILKEQGKPSILGLIEGQIEIGRETESANLVMNRKVKKVRFSPEHELIEFTRSGPLKRRSMRCSVSSGDCSLNVENVDSGKMNNENVGVTGRATRSKGLKLTEGKVNEKKKRGKTSSECYDRTDNVSAVENLDDGQLTVSHVHIAGRVTRLRGKAVVEVVENASKRGTKRAKDEDVRDSKKALDSADEKNLIEEIVGKHGRLTRSRRQKLMEASTEMEYKVLKVAENVDEIALVSAEIDETRIVIRKIGVVGDGKFARGTGRSVKSNVKGLEEVPTSDKIAGLNAVIAPQVLLRRSKRNENRICINGVTRKTENVGIEGLNETVKPMAADGTRVGTEITGTKVDSNGKAVVRVEKPSEPVLRRSNRRNHVIASDDKQGYGELKAENKRRCPLRGSVTGLVVADGVSKENKSRYPLRCLTTELVRADGVSKDIKKVRQPTPAIRRSIRREFLVSAYEKIDIDAAIENFETGLEKRCYAVQKNTRRSRWLASKKKKVVVLVDESDGGSFSQHKTEVKKRKRGPISRGDFTKTNNDPSSLAQSMNENQSEKAALAAAIGEVAGQSKPSSRSKEPYMDDTSYQDLPEIGESLHVDAQLSEGAESTSNPDLSNGKSTKNIVSDVGLASCRNKQDLSIEDTAERADMNELENLGENGASRIAELNTYPEKQSSASNIRNVEKVHSLLEFDVQELIDKDITDMDKIDHEAQMFSQDEGSNSSALIENQILPEGVHVSGNEGFAKTSSSADSLLIADQTDFKMAEAETDKHAQQSSYAVGRFGEVERISVQESLEIIETGEANVINLPIAFDPNDVNHLEASKVIVDSNNNNTSPKSGDVSIFESCGRRIDSTESNSALQLKEPSSGQLKTVGGDSTAEGDETILPNGIESKLAETERSAEIIPQDRRISSVEGDETILPNGIESKLAETERSAEIIPQDRRISSVEISVMAPDEQGMYNDSVAVGVESKSAKTGKGECLKDHISGINEFNVPDILDVVRSAATIIPQDRRISSRGTSVMASDEQGKHNESLDVAPITICANSTEINPNRGVEVGYSSERDEAHIDKTVLSEVAETGQDGTSMVHKKKCDEDGKLSAFNLFGAVRTAQDGEISSGDNFIKVSDDQGIFHDSLLVEPATVSNCGKFRDEADKIAEGHETYVFEDIQTELAETEEGTSPIHLPKSSHVEEMITCTNIQNVDNIVSVAEKISSFCGAESDTVSCSAMGLLFGNSEDFDIEKLKGKIHVINLEGDPEKNGEELYLEERNVNLNNIHTVEDTPASGRNEMLKESDVADIIKEYIDSESSLPADLDESCGTTFPIDVLAHIDEKTTCENAALFKSEGTHDKSSVKSLEMKSKEQGEAMLFTESALASGKSMKSPACVDLLVEGSTDDRSLVETEDWTEKKNARTILIHGTPAKVPKMADTKESAAKHKTSNFVGDFTAVRPAKRKALVDVQWK